MSPVSSTFHAESTVNSLTSICLSHTWAYLTMVSSNLVAWCNCTLRPFRINNQNLHSLGFKFREFDPRKDTKQIQNNPMETTLFRVRLTSVSPKSCRRQGVRMCFCRGPFVCGQKWRKWKSPLSIFTLVPKVLCALVVVTFWFLGDQISHFRLLDLLGTNSLSLFGQSSK